MFGYLLSVIFHYEFLLKKKMFNSLIVTV